MPSVAGYSPSTGTFNGVTTLEYNDSKVRLYVLRDDGEQYLELVEPDTTFAPSEEYLIYVELLPGVGSLAQIPVTANYWEDGLPSSSTSTGGQAPSESDKIVLTTPASVLNLEIVDDSLGRTIADNLEETPGGLILERDLVELKIDAFYPVDENEQYGESGESSSGALFDGHIELVFNELQYNIYRFENGSQPVSSEETTFAVGQAHSLWVELTNFYSEVKSTIQAVYVPGYEYLGGDDTDSTSTVIDIDLGAFDVVALTPLPTVDLDITRDATGREIADDREVTPGGAASTQESVELALREFDPNDVLSDHGIGGSIILTFDGTASGLLDAAGNSLPNFHEISSLDEEHAFDLNVFENDARVSVTATFVPTFDEYTDGSLGSDDELVDGYPTLDLGSSDVIRVGTYSNLVDINVTAPDRYGIEGSDDAYFLVSRGEGDFSEAVTIDFTWFGDGIDDEEDSVTLAAGENRKRVPFPSGLVLEDDSDIEWDKNYRIRLDKVDPSGAGAAEDSDTFYYIGENNEASLTIFDDDGVSARLSNNTDAFSTGLQRDSIGDGTVNVDLIDGAVSFDLGLFTYSTRANSTPIIDVVASLPDEAYGRVVDVKAILGDTAGDTRSLDLTDVEPGTSVHIAVLANADELSTGHYRYDIEVSYSEETKTIFGGIEIINTQDSEFGSGVQVSELNRLYYSDGSLDRFTDQGLSLHSNGIALVRGDFSSAWYDAKIEDLENVSSVAPEFEDEEEPKWDTGAGGYRFAENAGAAATWGLNVEAEKPFQVFVEWTPDFDRTSAATYSLDGVESLSGGGNSLTLNQTFVGGELSYGSQDYRSLGWFTSTETELELMLTSGLGITVAGSAFVWQDFAFDTPDGTIESEVGSGDQARDNGTLAFGASEFSDLGIENSDSNITLYNRYGSAYVFDNAGLQVATVDRNSNQTQYKYEDKDSDGKQDELVSIVSQGNLATQLIYESNGMLDRVTDFADRETDFTVTELEKGGETEWKLEKVLLPNSGSAQSERPEYNFTYNDEHQLETISEKQSVVSSTDVNTTINYDAHSIEVQYADNTKWMFTSMLADALNHTRIVGSGKIGDAELSGTTLQARATQTDQKGNDQLYQTDSFGLLAANSLPDVSAENGDVLNPGNNGQHVWTWERNEDGLVQKSTEPAGGGGATSLEELVTEYKYDDAGNLEKVTYAQDKQAGSGKIEDNWKYDPVFSQVTKYTDPVGRVTDYVLDDRGNVIHSIERDISGSNDGVNDDRVTSYTYTAKATDIDQLAGGLVKLTRFGATISAGSTALNKEYTSTALNLANAVTDQTSYFETGVSNIHLVKEVISAVGTNVASAVKYTYDNNRNLATSTQVIRQQADRTIRYQYDNLNQLVSVTNPVQGVVGGHGEGTSYYYYDAAGNLRLEFDNRQGDNLASATQSGNFTEYRYDDLNRLERTIYATPGGHLEPPQGRLVERYEYDDNNNLEKTILVGVNSDGSDRVTENKYDVRNRLVKTILNDPGFGSERPISAFAYDAHGNLAWEVDSRYGTDVGSLVRTEYTYDALGRLTQIKTPRPEGAASNPVVAYEYYDDSRLHTETSSNAAGGQNKTTYTYDGLARVSNIQTGPANAPSVGQRSSTTYIYDSRDNITNETNTGSYTTASATVTGTTETQYFYDALDRVITVEGAAPDGGSEKTGLNVGVSSYFIYNDAGELTQELVFAGTVNESHTADGTITSAEIISVRNSVWQRSRNDIARVTEYTYDNLGRLHTTVGPSASQNTRNDRVTTTYSYDVNHNQTDVVVSFHESTTEGGMLVNKLVSLVSTAKFDNWNRVWQAYSPETESGRQELRIRYNVDGTIQSRAVKNPNDVAPDGSPVVLTDGWVFTSYAYNNLGQTRIVRTEDPADTADGLLSNTFTYFGDGQVKQAVDGRGLETLYFYDDAGLVKETRVEQAIVGTAGASGTYLRSLTTYNTVGLVSNQRQSSWRQDASTGVVTTSDYGDGTTYTYDNAGNVLLQRQDIGGDSGTGHTAFGYDEFGYRNSITDSVGNETVLEVDDLGRVVRQTSNAPETFVYDAFGNLIQSTNRNSETVFYTHDNLGRVLSRSSLSDSNSYSAYDYTPLGELKLAENFDSDGLITRHEYSYNIARRHESVEQTHGSLGDEKAEFIYDYDLVGNVTSVNGDLPSDAFNGEDNEVVAETFGDHDYANSYSYDSLNRVTYASQSSINGSGAGVPGSTVTFARQNVVFNNNSTPVVATYIQRSEGGDRIAATQYVTAASGRIEAIHHTEGELTEDQGSQLGFDSERSILSEQLDYDPRGLLVERTTSRPNSDGTTAATEEVNYRYDNFGQLEFLTRDPSDPAASTATTDYVYDDNGNLEQTSTYAGVNVTYSSTTTDGFNRLIDNGSFRFEYDTEGNVVSRLEFGSVTTGSENAPEAITQNNSSLYTANGNWTPGTYRVSLDKVEFDFDAFTGVFSEADLTQGITATVFAGGDVVGTFNIGLEMVDGDWAISDLPDPFVFDLNQEITHDNIVIQFTYENNYQAEIRRFQGSAFTVSKAASLQILEWDYLNRLSRVTDYNVSATGTTRVVGNSQLKVIEDFVKEYKYDAVGNLVFEQNGDENSIYIWERGQRVADFTTTDTIYQQLEIEGVRLQRLHFYAPGTDTLIATKSRVDRGDYTSAQLIAAAPNGGVTDELRVLLTESDSELRTLWALLDERGSPQAYVHKLGDELQTISVSYDATGSPTINIPDSLSSFLNDSSPLVIFSAGREYDFDTGLYFNRSRWFDPSSSRFISEDPTGFAGGDANLYRYAGNSFANATDPSGNTLVNLATGAIGAGVGAVIGGAAYALTTDNFTWGGLIGSTLGGAAIGGLAGLTFGGSLAASAAAGAAGGIGGYTLAGAAVGGVHGALDAQAAGGGAGSTLFGAALGAGAGALNPAGEFASFGGAIAGGFGEYIGGGPFLGNGFLAGGLVGTLAGGFGSALQGGTLRAGVRAIAPEVGGGIIGGGIGYGLYGNSGILPGATFGSLGGRVGYGTFSAARSGINRLRAPKGAGIIKPSPGVTVRKVGNYFIKEVDQNANWLARWHGKRSLRFQSEALTKLGDMAPSHLLKNGKLITRDAGTYTPGNFWSTWAKGSWRLGTPVNDIRPRNIGANGLIFDPAIDPLVRPLYWTAGAGTVGAGGYGIYELFDGDE